MKRLIRSLSFLLVGSFFLPMAGTAATPAGILPSLSPILKKVSPGIVNVAVKGTIHTQQNPLFQDPFFRHFFHIPQQQQPSERQMQAVGSGVVINAGKGYIVTNNHVVAHADDITVVLSDKRRLKAKLVGTDPEADIAVLKVDKDHLTEVPLGDSDQLNVGDFVIAIGNPFGLGQTATLGIVSALGRSGLGIEGYENFIQTDASINPGNSGGALIDQQGRLVGINTAILSRSGGNIGIGFAIPINMVKQIADQIIKHGGVKRGRVGVLIQDLTPDLAKAMKIDADSGAVITRVVPGSAADKAGLKQGDVIVSLNDEVIKGASGLRNRVGLMRPGQRVKIGYFRNGEKKNLLLKLGKAGNFQTGADGSVQFKGLTVTTIPSDHPRHGSIKGLLVRKVDGNSPAALAGLQPGDIIVSVDQQPVADVSALRKVLQAHPKESLLLNVRRGQGAMFIVLK